MKILFVGSEAIPFISTGGLGDVLGSLPAALVKSRSDNDIRVVLPLFKSIKEKFSKELQFVGETTVQLSWRNQYCGLFLIEKDGVKYYFVDNEYYFNRDTVYGNYDDGERYSFFGKAALDIMPLIDFYPDVLHCNDWQSAMSIVYLKRKYHANSRYASIKTIYTIHNIDYQGIYGIDILEDVLGLDTWGDRGIMEYNGCVNLTKGAIVCTDRVSTVSQRYANEIQTEFYSSGLHHVLHMYASKVSGIYGIDILEDVLGLDTWGDRGIMEYNGCVNLTKGAIVCTDRVSTVSQRYANEIQTEFYSSGLHHVLHMYASKVSGIVNGIDVNYYDPAKDNAIASKYSISDMKGKAICKEELQKLAGLPVKADVPVVSMVSRLASHKGFDLVNYILHEILDFGVQFVLLGTGEAEIEDYLRELQAKYPDQVKVFFEFNKELSKKIYAGSDIFLMPSKSEPCGLSQMIASRYGTVPVVRETGGLYDTIKPYNKYTGEGNGFTFANYNAHEMKDAVKRAVELYSDKKKWNTLVKKVMDVDFSWNASAEKYMDLYKDVSSEY